VTNAVPVRPGHLRDAAEKIEHDTGLRVQIIGGTLVMSPAPRGRRAVTIARFRDVIAPHLPAELGAWEMLSIPMPEDPDDYATPDLTVLPEAVADTDEWLFPGEEVELAVEVISKSERAKDITGKTYWYAAAHVAAVLALDPRDGTWSLYTHPRDGSYQGVLHGKYGEDIPLPTPLSCNVPTSGLPLYGNPR
jgi:Uma2 family endonuclease